jgi:hypothetical protein
MREETLRYMRLARNALLGVSLLCLGLPEAEAIEIFAPPGIAAHMDDGVIVQVRGGRGGGGMRHGGGMHRGGGMRGGGAYRGGGARYAGRGYRGGAGYGYRGGYGRYGYRGGYGYRGYGYGYRGYGYGYGAALGAAAIGAAAAHHCWIDSYGYRVRNYNYY